MLNLISSGDGFLVTMSTFSSTRLLHGKKLILPKRFLSPLPPVTGAGKAKANAIEKKLSYSKVENHFQKIQTVIPDSRRSGRDQILSEEQYRQMLLFKTEAIVYLQQWSQDDAINEK